MKFALMQPYFFPYSGYFSMISSVNHFMFFDHVQFVKKSWMVRNRLINLSNGKTFYIRPELQNVVYQSLLTTIELKEDEKWKLKLFSQIEGYKNKAKYFSQTKGLLYQLLTRKYSNLAELNIETIRGVAEYLDIQTKIDKYTDYNFAFKNKPEIGDWGREVSLKVDANEYINAPGGESFIFPEGFESNNIKLGFIQPNLTPYKQGTLDFIAGLSILDVLMFNGQEKTKELIKNYDIKWKN